MTRHHRTHRGTDVTFPDARTRASDADRERTIDLLRDHAGAGRLDVQELEARIERAQRATTLGDLQVLRDDLPRLPGRGATRDGRGRQRQREHFRVYVAVIVLLVVIWALSGAGYFWPLWPALGWGLAFLPGPCAKHKGPRGQHGPRGATS